MEPATNPPRSKVLPGLWLESFAYHAGVFREESLSVSKPLGGLGGIVRRPGR
jgi:hypothetical protein